MIENPMINYIEEEPEVVAHCSNCGEELTEQHSFYSLNCGSEFLCDTDCIMEYLDIQQVEGWELKC